MKKKLKDCNRMLDKYYLTIETLGSIGFFDEQKMSPELVFALMDHLKVPNLQDLSEEQLKECFIKKHGNGK